MKSLKITSIILLMLYTSFSLAENADRNKPINITADFGSLDQQNETTIWKGNVVITQGTLRFSADQVVVRRTKDGQQHVVATGNPVSFQQKLEGKPQYVKGKGAKVQYSSKNNIVILSGNAQVSRDGDVVQGNQITYNTITEFYTVSGSKGNQVKVTLQPSTTSKKEK